MPREGEPLIRHFDEETLYEYLDDPEAFPFRDELEAHLPQCASCRAALDELCEFEAALSSSALWDFAEAVRRHREPPGAMRSIADQLVAEDADANDFLKPILTSPAAFRRANVASTPELHTAGVVRSLCATSRMLRERQPMHALTLADSAIAISERLSADHYPETLRSDLSGQAWLERANSLRYLGRHPEALDALDIAERAFENTPVAAYSIALVQYLRSVVFFKMEQHDEAMQLARQSARVFRQFGESARFTHAKIVQGGVLFHLSRFREALELFLSLIPVAKDLGDAETLARLYSNVANCYLSLDQLSDASSYFAQAISLYEALGMETESIRTRWSLGRMLVRSGDVRDGIVRLRQAKRDFERLGATTDAALVALNIIEALLAIGDLRGAAELCTGLVESFTNVGMTGGALTALGFLRETIAHGSATPVIVQQVRMFLEKRE
ncbi:MAG TPA: tetratricopeptide repeat protein [Thermoanaerobaculia bacterium]|nr:tetratricopeptide repeat protein [Thermoanaerobaculia bacterium]